MKFFTFLLCFLATSATAATWSGFSGEYHALDATYCDEVLKAGHQNSPGMPEAIFFYAGTRSEVKKLFSFPIGEWGTGDGYSYSYETKSDSQGHYFTHLVMNASKHVVRELHLKIDRETATEIQAFDMLFEDMERNESRACSYSRVSP